VIGRWQHILKSHDPIFWTCGFAPGLDQTYFTCCCVFLCLCLLLLSIKKQKIK